MPDYYVDIIETRLYRVSYIVRGVADEEAAHNVARFEEGEYTERIEDAPVYIDTIDTERDTIEQIEEVGNE